jgi:NAD(P)-dependent dehydrogenase (short-subunit alcohol dehydrogenase family)
MSETFTLLPAPGSRVAIAGGCGGIGRAIVKRAVEIGLQVAVLDLPRSIEQSPPPPGVLVLACDALEEASIAAAFAELSARWGKLEALINLVGFTKERVRIENMPLTEWNEITAGSLTSAFLLSRAAIPMLKAAGGGSIVHTASTFGVSVPMPGYGVQPRNPRQRDSPRSGADGLSARRYRTAGEERTDRCGSGHQAPANAACRAGRRHGWRLPFSDWSRFRVHHVADHSR